MHGPGATGAKRLARACAGAPRALAHPRCPRRRASCSTRSGGPGSRPRRPCGGWGRPHGPRSRSPWRGAGSGRVGVLLGVLGSSGAAREWGGGPGRGAMSAQRAPKNLSPASPACARAHAGAARGTAPGDRRELAWMVWAIDADLAAPTWVHVAIRLQRRRAPAHWGAACHLAARAGTHLAAPARQHQQQAAPYQRACRKRERSKRRRARPGKTPPRSQPPTPRRPQLCCRCCCSRRTPPGALTAL